MTYKITTLLSKFQTTSNKPWVYLCLFESINIIIDQNNVFYFIHACLFRIDSNKPTIFIQRL